MTRHATISRPDVATAAVTTGWRTWFLVATGALAAYSTGLSWQAQFVSYPLFRVLTAAEFPGYHLAYNDAILWVVIVPGFLTFLACAALPFTRPDQVSRATAWVVALTGVGSLLSTVLWAIPMHDALDRIGQDAATIDSLLLANGARTAFLTAGAIALSWCLARLIRRQPPVTSARPRGR